MGQAFLICDENICISYHICTIFLLFKKKKNFMPLNLLYANKSSTSECDSKHRKAMALQGKTDQCTIYLKNGKRYGICIKRKNLMS